MLEDRVQGVERELLGLKERIARIEAGTEVSEPVPVSGPEAVVPTRLTPPPPPGSRPQATRPPAATAGRAPERPPRPAKDPVELEDLLGGRVLAWLGGVAVLVGLAFLLALGISSGWIGEGARVVMGGATAALLIGAGVWLHERRGRTDAALASLSAGIAAMFAVAGVGAQVYDVLSVPIAVGLAMATGSLATWLAVRWRSQGIAALGILGAMVAPAVAGAAVDFGSVALLFVAACAAVTVVISQGWRWLSFGTICIAMPQWMAFVAERYENTGQTLAVLVAFGLLGIAAAVGHELRDRPERLSASTAFLLMLNALAIGCTGWFALLGGAGGTQALVFVWALAAVHGVLAAACHGRERLPRDLALLLFTVSTLLADAAFALTFDGPVRSLGWAATAVGFAVLEARSRVDSREGTLLSVGLGGHLALSMVQVLASDVTPGAMDHAGAASITSIMSVTGLAAACFASGRLAERHEDLRKVLDVVGLAAVAYLTAITVDGVALVVAFAAEAVALAGIARRTGDPVAVWAAPVALAGAALLALGLAPVEALGSGLRQPLAATGALGSVAVAALAIGRLVPAEGLAPWLRGAGALVALYLASVLVVTPFQPGGAASQSALFDLPVREQGQVVLSALWAACGVTGIVVGLVRDVREVRLAALGLAGLAVAKVFLFDLATLTSVYRVVSFIALGLFLLVAAYAWQRVRPRAHADAREVPRGIR